MNKCFSFTFLILIGISTGEFNVNDERLSHQLGIFTVPSLCAISQGRVYHFNKREFSEKNIKEFIRKLMPTKRFVPTVCRKIEQFHFISFKSKKKKKNILFVVLISS